MINEVIDIFLIAVFINIIINLCYKFLSDQSEIKKIKDSVKTLNEKMKKEEDKEAKSKLMNEVMQENSKMMKMNMKPMLASMVIVFLILGWLFSSYKQATIISPFALPFIGTNLGWFWWYLVCSIPLVIILRRVMGINV